MWAAYLRSTGVAAPETADPPSSGHFCDNQPDADECAALVERGLKRATAPSLWWFVATRTPLPRVGDLHVVTDWSGEARCVIRTTAVEIVPFEQVSAEHAAAEGEGDRSLAHWRRVHRDYYERELAGTGREPAEDMPIVCERFAVVYPEALADGETKSPTDVR